MQPLGRIKRHQITRRGIARTFQNIRLCGEMTALENVIVGTDARHRTSVPGALIRSPAAPSRGAARPSRRPSALLQFVGIADRAEEKAKNLPYGDQRRLEIARALATEPKLLCLDEPAAGFNPSEKAALIDLIRKIRDDGYTVLLIEHDMRLVMGVTDRIVVLEFGRKIADGPPAEIRANPAVIAAYLGVPDDELVSLHERPVLLEVRDIVVHYGRIQALHGVSLQVRQGELVTLLGCQRGRQDDDDAGHLRAASAVIGIGVVRGPATSPGSKPTSGSSTG